MSDDQARSTTDLLIFDDHRVFAEALATALDLEPDIDVVGIAGTVEEAIKVASRERPEVVLLDYRLPDGDGTETCRGILAGAPETRVVLLTSFAEIPVLVEAVDAGASAFLPKTSTFAEVTEAVRAARQGETLLSARMLQTLLAHLQSKNEAGAPPRTETPAVEPLTPRELDVLALLARGHSKPQAAEQLVVSPHTVRTHVQNILRELGVHSQLAAVSLALRLGLVQLSDEP
jgi:DNA-binding NarL/FixJ family response regulator